MSHGYAKNGRAVASQVGELTPIEQAIVRALVTALVRELREEGKQNTA